MDDTRRGKVGFVLSGGGSRGAYEAGIIQYLRTDLARRLGRHVPIDIDRYKAGQLIVPLYISAGDHDTFGIALQSAMLYERLRLHQPGQVELRILDGDHEWALWRDSLGEALQFMSARMAGPR